MSTNSRRTWRVAPVVFALVCSLSCASAFAGHAALIGKAQGLAIGRKAAIGQGFDLNRYALDTFGDQSGGGKTKWLFVYLCRPQPSAPGCSFMVVVDRRTGVATVLRGK